MVLFRSIHPGLRSVFSLFVLTTFLSILRVIWIFDLAPELSFWSKVFMLGLGALFNSLFYATIAYYIYRKSSYVRYGYSTLTLISLFHYCGIALFYYLRTGSLEHTDFNNLMILAPQLFSALLLFNPELDDYFTSKHAEENTQPINPETIRNLI